ncbi:PREDICTED: inositol polyphosphate 5-phosphatase OCRL-1-like, partial [Amphimedon queenslandica]|uniref:Inositol polyphosphate-related phosphatase domain-containing protein n=1 Tax=Amphimedon queenslandica TaxID=400682 RepID=A0AAN0JWY9_AMPQE
LFCGTWNVNGQYPIQRVDKWLVYQETIPDIFAIGFQELDLSPEALLRNETSREEPWIDLVESSLKMAGKFKKVKK